MTNEERILAILEEQNATLQEYGHKLAEINMTMENQVAPALRSLSEGQQDILTRLVPRSELDELREEVSFLKEVLRMHTQQLNELKKAQ